MEGSCVVININIKPITINIKSINIPYQTFTRKVLTDKWVIVTITKNTGTIIWTIITKATILHNRILKSHLILKYLTRWSIVPSRAVALFLWYTSWTQDTRICKPRAITGYAQATWWLKITIHTLITVTSSITILYSYCKI